MNDLMDAIDSEGEALTHCYALARARAREQLQQQESETPKNASLGGPAFIGADRQDPKGESFHVQE